MAANVLRRPHDETGFGIKRIAQIVDTSSSLRPMSWCICDPNEQDGGNYQVMMHIWLADIDFPDMDSIENECDYDPDTPQYQEEFQRRLPTSPTIVTDRILLPTESVRDELSLILGAALPVVVELSPSNDESACEVTLGSDRSGVTYRWWGDGPVEWREFVLAANRLLGHMRRLYRLK